MTVQSKEDVTKRWEKSTGPPELWLWMPVMGPWWPSNISLMPALLLHTHTQKQKLSSNHPHFILRQSADTVSFMDDATQGG